MRKVNYFTFSLLILYVMGVSCNRDQSGFVGEVLPSDAPLRSTITPGSPPNIKPTDTDSFTRTPSLSIFSATSEKTQVSTPTVSPTPSATKLSSTHTTVPPSGTDELDIDLTSKGYTLLSTGSITISDAEIYSASLYIKSEFSPYFGASETSPEAFYLAFYRTDGGTKNLLGVQSLPPYANQYPAAGLIVDWNTPFQPTQLLTEAINPDQETRQVLSLSGFSSDINRNGMQEFTLAAEYCPTSCNQTVTSLYFYEIQSTSIIVNITADLPGFIDPEAILFSNDPPAIQVQDIDSYDIYINVESFWIYKWNGKRYVDVSRQYVEVYKDMVETILGELRERFNNPFSEGLAPKILKILLLYEKMGLRQEGLQIFLEVTDIKNWPGTTDYEKCWLEISRATAQEDFARRQPFHMPPNMFWLDVPSNFLQAVQPFIQAGYNLASCQSLLP